jgi:flagellar FliJ protein
VKRFEFHLDGLLRVKRRQEHLAELEQQKAQFAVHQASARLDHLRDEMARLSDSLAARVGQAVPADRWVTAYDLLDKMGRQIESAEGELQLAERRLDDARQARVQVSTEVEAIDTLRQQRWDQWKQDVARADQERLDELSVRMWSAGQAARSGAA